MRRDCAARTLRLAAALVALNFAFTFESVWPTLWVQPQLALSVEAAAIVLALALVARGGRRAAMRLVGGLAALATVLAAGRYADVTITALFGRPINLYWDGRHLPEVFALVTDGRTAAIAAAGAAGLALVLAAVFVALRWSLRTIARVAVVARGTLGIASGAVVAAFVVGQAGALDTGRYFVAPVSAAYAAQARFVADALSRTAADERLAPSPAFVSRLRRLDGADVLVVFLESYGAATYDRPDYARALDAHRAALDAAARSAGRAVVSAFVRSPTFGGASWLAHASLLAGIGVDAARYDLLLTTRRPTLVRHFRDHGYDAFALMPGLRADWPEGAFYGFDAIVDSRALAYPGPEFGFWRIPDQFALARLEATALDAPARRPAFVLFPTITSHIPFQPLPPYQPDWQRLLGTDPFDADGVARSAAQPDWDRLAPAYVATIGYAYDWLTGFLQRPAARDYVLVVVGDHQPVSAVAGERAPWEVPVHVITRKAEIADALVAAGFRPGIVPARPALGAMHDLTRVLLEAFDAPQSPLALDSARRRAPRVDVP